MAGVTVGNVCGDNISILQNKLKDFVCHANNAVHLKLVKQQNDINDESTTFHPEFSHQLFGESESIFGYKGLKAELYYSAAKLTTYLGISYKEKVDSASFDGVQPDNVLATIAKVIPPGYCQTLDDFTLQLAKDEDFKPFGCLINTFDKGTKNKTYEVYKANVSSPGFREFHERLQTFILWFIDGASFIDVDDDRWNYYLVFERNATEGNPTYSIVGYMTVYSYYAYPKKIRPRISQMLVLPPFQKQGLGSRLLQAVYDDVIQDSDVIDITVEDPSDDFMRIRDYVDARNCSKLGAFHSDKLKEGFSSVMASEAQEKLRINKKQARRVYEILRLRVTNTSDESEYKTYRLDVKNRLNKPFSKYKQFHEKLKKALSSEEINATFDNLSPQDRLDRLQKLYEETEKEYRHTLERLDRLRP